LKKRKKRKNRINNNSKNFENKNFRSKKRRMRRTPLRKTQKKKKRQLSISLRQKKTNLNNKKKKKKFSDLKKKIKSWLNLPSKKWISIAIIFSLILKFKNLLNLIKTATDRFRKTRRRLALVLVHYIIQL
jgi:hypothetical protein